MISSLAAFFFESVWGKTAALLALIGGLGIGFALDQRHQGANNERVRQAVEDRQAQQAVDELESMAIEARNRALAPGAAQRLLEHSCRDCGAEAGGGVGEAGEDGAARRLYQPR